MSFCGRTERRHLGSQREQDWSLSPGTSDRTRLKSKSIFTGSTAVDGERRGEQPSLSIPEMPPQPLCILCRFRIRLSEHGPAAIRSAVSKAVTPWTIPSHPRFQFRQRPGTTRTADHTLLGTVARSIAAAKLLPLANKALVAAPLKVLGPCSANPLA